MLSDRPGKLPGDPPWVRHAAARHCGEGQGSEMMDDRESACVSRACVCVMKWQLCAASFSIFPKWRRQDQRPQARAWITYQTRTLSRPPAHTLHTYTALSQRGLWKKAPRNTGRQRTKRGQEPRRPAAHWGRPAGFRKIPGEDKSIQTASRFNLFNIYSPEY